MKTFEISKHKKEGQIKFKLLERESYIDVPGIGRIYNGQFKGWFDSEKEAREKANELDPNDHRIVLD